MQSAGLYGFNPYKGSCYDSLKQSKENVVLHSDETDKKNCKELSFTLPIIQKDTTVVTTW